jgi:hypothetical protein
VGGGGTRRVSINANPSLTYGNIEVRWRTTLNPLPLTLSDGALVFVSYTLKRTLRNVGQGSGGQCSGLKLVDFALTTSTFKVRLTSIFERGMLWNWASCVFHKESSLCPLRQIQQNGENSSYNSDLQVIMTICYYPNL